MAETTAKTTTSDSTSTSDSSPSPSQSEVSHDPSTETTSENIEAAQVDKTPNPTPTSQPSSSTEVPPKEGGKEEEKEKETLDLRCALADDECEKESTPVIIALPVPLQPKIAMSGLAPSRQTHTLHLSTLPGTFPPGYFLFSINLLPSLLPQVQLTPCM
jgi:hypothetical protein